MNNLQIFVYSGEQLRTVQREDGLWWVLRDVCRVLNIANSKNVSARLDDDEKGVHLVDTPGGTQEMTIINEPGLYAVILRSDKPEAKAFKRWVTHDVLPSIRKTGGYIAGSQSMTDAEIMATALQIANRTIDQNKAKIKELEPKGVFADAVSASKSSILVGELAKVLRQNGINMGEKRLFDWLHNNGYLVRRNGGDRNMPTQRSVEQGLFVIKETIITHSDGHITVRKTAKVTGKGQVYFVNKFLGGRHEAGNENQ